MRIDTGSTLSHPGVISYPPRGMHMAADDPIIEAKALALAGVGVAFGILTRLEKKGLITPRDADEILESILSSLEGYLPPDDPAVQKARVLVDILARVAATDRPVPQPS
jgi:hypothetical protein